jgi:hypothetical protein
LPYSSAIRLSTGVWNIQGCDFVSETRLLCSSNAIGKPLHRIDLAAPMSGSDVAGQVTTLGSLPQVSSCSGDFETECIDYDTRDGKLRVSVGRCWSASE